MDDVAGGQHHHHPHVPPENKDDQQQHEDKQVDRQRDAEPCGVPVEASGEHVQRDGVVAAGGEQGGVRGVQAKVSDGFGGEVLKRSYWRKRMVPDGLVQRRIDQFSTRVPKLGEGVG